MYAKDLEDGALAAKSGAILVDMTTSDPSLAVEIAEAAKAKGVHSVDAPVSGGDIVRRARLSIMIGGEKPVVDAPAAPLRSHGEDHHPPRRTRAGQHTKLTNQILIARASSAFAQR